MTSDPWPRRHDLVADVLLYPTRVGGRRSAAQRGYRCPCFATRDRRRGGWDARLDLGDEPFEPGTRRRVGFWFLTTEGAEAMRRVGRFYLWDTRFVGEAETVA